MKLNLSEQTTKYRSFQLEQMNEFKFIVVLLHLNHLLLF